MATPITKDQADAYSKKPTACPYCRRSDYSVYEQSDFDTAMSEIWVRFSCGSCGRGWKNTYQLISVADLEENRWQLSDVWVSKRRTAELVTQQ